jgi:hypothetical protein
MTLMVNNQSARNRKFLGTGSSRRPFTSCWGTGNHVPHTEMCRSRDSRLFCVLSQL